MDDTFDIYGIIDYYLKGNTLRETAEKFGTNHRRIRLILLEMGIKPRDKKEAAIPQAKFRNCVICGVRFRVRSGWKDGGNLNRKTCSDNCFKRLMHEKQLESNNSYWKGGHSQAHYQRVRETYKLQICEICGKTNKDARLDTHHKDRNKSNNRLDNLMVLCAACHTRLHYRERNKHDL
jgi:hypothetical protein